MTDSHSTLQLSKFISEQNLVTRESIVLFDAVITFYRGDSMQTIFSEVQIITLPKEMVVYVLEFMKETYHKSEIFSTSLYLFNFINGNTLEIREKNHTDLLLLSIKPLEKTDGKDAGI